jgi:hypothetical protein
MSREPRRIIPAPRAAHVSRIRALGLGGLAALAGLAAGCGGSSGSGASLASVAGCLKGAGYGVTAVPKSDLVTGGAENRGPGQTAELLAGRNGSQPQVGGDDGDAVIAFWASAKLASDSPNANAKGLGTHADSIGKITVQPTTQLVLYALHVAKTPSARRAAYEAQVRKIESCVR